MDCFATSESFANSRELYLIEWQSIMKLQQDPPIVLELMEWCAKRKEGREARRFRVPMLIHEFKDILGDKIPIITVTGTSGKGTTCALLEAVLVASGHTPGVVTKPHLFSFRERISVAGHWVSNAEFAEHTELIFSRLREFVRKHGAEFHPALFEALLLVAASIFRQRGVSIAVFEAGIGGSNDATSFLPARLSVITSVNLDHQIELGSTIEEIARDKAGIAATGGVLVLGAGLSERARSVVISESASRGIRCVQADGNTIEVLSRRVEGQSIRFAHASVDYTVFLPCPGPHQVATFATVWTVTKLLHEFRDINSLEAIYGVERTRIPGRFEFIEGSPSWLLDVAHNPASIEALISTASLYFLKDRIVAVLGATESHDYRTFVKLICLSGIRPGFCEGFARAVSVHKLSAEVVNRVEPLGLFHTPAEAIDYFVNAQVYHEKVVMVTGSLLLVGQWRHELAQRGMLPGGKQ